MFLNVSALSINSSQVAVIVTRIRSISGHIFVQQTSHPTFAALPRLDLCLNNVYGKTTTPEVDRSEINVGLVCVAPCDGKWYRVQVRYAFVVSLRGHRPISASSSTMFRKIPEVSYV